MGKSIIGKLFIPGGVVSPGDLRRIATTAYHFGINDLQLGARQEVLLKFPEKYQKEISLRFQNIQYKFAILPSIVNNTVASYPLKAISKSTKWLTEGVYLEILGAINKESTLKINLCDPFQSMFPLFSGNMNFIASSYENYWYLYLNLPDFKKRVQWPVLIDSREIAALVDAIEEVVKGNGAVTFETLVKMIYDKREWTFRVITENFNIPNNRFFYYEGLHPMGENRYWLGIYERLNKYPVTFIESLAQLCLQTNVGSISISGFKSLIVKNIQEKDVPLWENLLNRFKINTCHSSLEVNFRIPDQDEKALALRKYIFQYFDNREVRSEGLTFGLHTYPNDASASVFVERKSVLKIRNIEILPYYNISYRKNFDVNNPEIIPFEEHVKRRDVPEVLMLLCDQYHEQLAQKKTTDPATAKAKEDIKPQDNEVYICSDCLTTYDEVYGDSFNNVPAGTPFSILPETYQCPVCDAPKGQFKLVLPETEKI